jgi:hypothetical protein
MVAMNDLKNLAKSGMELREPRRQSLFGFGRTSRKLAAYLLAALITVAMAVWIVVLSWGLLTVSQWLLASFHSFWSWF